MACTTWTASELPLSRFDLPGSNLPLNWTPGGHGKLFPNALDFNDLEGGFTQLPLTTLRELTMLQIMNSITDKPGWETKVFDDSIAQKWKDEAMATEGRDVTPNMMDWIVAELRYRCESFSKTGILAVYNGEVVKSDNAVSESLKKALQTAVKPLEDVPEVYKDYHPGSDGKVLDLVHPSLFPLVYDLSRILEDSLVGLDECMESIGKGNLISLRPEDEQVIAATSNRYNRWRAPDKPYSKNFQWLPCEVEIPKDSDDVKITSYINNLHPQKHPELYGIVEQIIGKAIPLWNMTLTGLTTRHEEYRRIEMTDLEFDPNPEEMTEEEQIAMGAPRREEDGDEDAHYELMWEWEKATRKAVLPDAEEFKSPPEREIVDLRRDFSERSLQVIVKLANIELSPDKPSYDGGSWHVEGALNEHICATALYYYDSQNITESRLAFRQQSATDEAQEINYPQQVHEWLAEIYGCDPDGPAVQEVGSVVCSEGRLLTFPNILQHQVQPFSLTDKTKPGHRKILALFLVDPHIKIISTANVPPQQKVWWSEEVTKQMQKSGKALSVLSAELKDKVFEDVDGFPIGMDEAKEIRLALMEQRKKYVQDQGRAFEQHEFSLCEH